MKKNLTFLFLCFLLISCTPEKVYIDATTGKEVKLQEPNIVYKDNGQRSDIHIIETITINGETHEFVIRCGVISGMAHWPDCKYCKHKETFEYDD